MKGKVKNIIIFVVIFIAAVLVYNFFFKGERDAAPLVTTTGPVTPVAGIPAGQLAIGQEFLTVLLNLKNLRLDNTILLSDEFNSLRDFSIPLVQKEEEGRPNPFAPFGAEVELAVNLVVTIEATDITATSATLKGSVDPSIIDADKRFEWGEDDETLGNKTTLITLETQTGFFSQEITDLTPDTIYYFEAQALVGARVISGEVLTFTTLE